MFNKYLSIRVFCRNECAKVIFPGALYKECSRTDLLIKFDFLKTTEILPSLLLFPNITTLHPLFFQNKFGILSTT